MFFREHRCILTASGEVNMSNRALGDAPLEEAGGRAIHGTAATVAGVVTTGAVQIIGFALAGVAFSIAGYKLYRHWRRTREQHE